MATRKQYVATICFSLFLGVTLPIGTSKAQEGPAKEVKQPQSQAKSTRSPAPIKWETRLNLSIYNKEVLAQLMDQLDPKYPVLALSVAQQALMMVEDSDLSKHAYEQVIRLVDKGVPFSLMDMFNIGNLRLNDYDYNSQSYNFFKGILAKNKKMNEWSEGFLKLIDKTNFGRYQYYEALGLINEKKFDEAKEKLRNLLKVDYDKDHFAFAKKIARTLAQLHFTLKEYDAAKEIYQDFLLKVNPVRYADWIELAWVQFYQNDFSGSLGSLVNIKSSGNTGVSFEPYIIKASIYKQLCDDKSVKKLSEEFNSQYKGLIDRVTLGADIENDQQLEEILAHVNEDFFIITFMRKHLTEEIKRFESDRSMSNTKLVMGFYEAEINRLERMRTYYYQQAKSSALSKIIEISESLRFLAFYAAREKFNTKYVFKVKRKKLDFFTYNQFKDQFVLWRHNGLFFNDERLNYKVELFDQCDHL